MTFSELAHGVPPGLVLIVGAGLVPFLRGRLRNAYLLALPAVGLLQLVPLETGDHIRASVLGLELLMLRVDRLALVFG